MVRVGRNCPMRGRGVPDRCCLARGVRNVRSADRLLNARMRGVGAAGDGESRSAVRRRKAWLGLLSARLDPHVEQQKPNHRRSQHEQEFDIVHGQWICRLASECGCPEDLAGGAVGGGEDEGKLNVRSSGLYCECSMEGRRLAVAGGGAYLCPGREFCPFGTGA